MAIAFGAITKANPQFIAEYLQGRKSMETDNKGKQDGKDRKSASRKIVVEATAIMILLALVLVIVGYSFLHFYCLTSCTTN